MGVASWKFDSEVQKSIIGQEDWLNLDISSIFLSCILPNMACDLSLVTNKYIKNGYEISMNIKIRTSDGDGCI